MQHQPVPALCFSLPREQEPRGAIVSWLICLYHAVQQAMKSTKKVLSNKIAFFAPPTDERDYPYIEMQAVYAQC